MDEIIEDKLILLDITPKTKIIMRTEDDKLYFINYWWTIEREVKTISLQMPENLLFW